MTEQGQMLYIRADAGPEIGTGHVMRCLALAGAWKRLGGRCAFIGRIDEKIRPRIDGAGCGLIDLHGTHPDPTDIQLTTTLLSDSVDSEKCPVWTVLDGYHFDAGYRAAIRSTGSRVLAILDQPEEGNIDADIILNQNAYAEELGYSASPGAELLLGTRYA